MMRSRPMRDMVLTPLMLLAVAGLTVHDLPAQSPPMAVADTTNGPDAREIRRRRESSNVAIARHDTAGIGAILAPGVMVLTSNSVPSIGRETNVRRFAEQFRSRPDVVYRRTPSVVSVFAAWRMASEYGRWTGSWTDNDGPLSIGGVYFAKWRQVGGEWFVESETYVPESCSGGRYCLTVP